MKKAYIKYLLLIITFLGIGAQLQANTSLKNISHFQENSSLQQKHISSHSSKGSIEFEKIIAEEIENEEVKNYKDTANQETLSYTSSYSFFLCVLIFSEFLNKRKNQTTYYNRIINRNLCKKYIQFEVFRI